MSLGATILDPTPEKVIGLLAIAAFALSVGTLVIRRRARIATKIDPTADGQTTIGRTVSWLAVGGGTLFILSGLALVTFAVVVWLGPSLWGGE